MSWASKAFKKVTGSVGKFFSNPVGYLSKHKDVALSLGTTLLTGGLSGLAGVASVAGKGPLLASGSSGLASALQFGNAIASDEERAALKRDLENAQSYSGDPSTTPDVAPVGTIDPRQYAENNPRRRRRPPATLLTGSLGDSTLLTDSYRDKLG
jgi:hypothetical protein